MTDRHDMAALLNQLTGEGVLDSGGRFTLDPQQALEKARNLRFADPGQYLRCLYRGAVLGEAANIDVYVDSDDTIFRFDGPPLTDSQLRYLAASVYVEDDSYCGRKLQQLAMGLLGCWAAGYTQAEIHSRESAYRFLPDSAEPVEIAPQGTWSNEIRLKRKFGVQVVSRFLTSRLPEEEVFLKGMGWSAVTTHFNGREMTRNRCRQGEFRVDTGLPQPMHLRCWDKPEVLNVPGLTFELSMIMDQGDPQLPGRFQLILADVDAGEYALPECPGMSATVAVGPLRLDASQRRPVEDDEFHQLLDSLRGVWALAVLESGQTQLLPRALQLLKRPYLKELGLIEKCHQLPLVPCLGWESRVSPARARGRRIIVGMPELRPRDALYVIPEEAPLLEFLELPFERAADVLVGRPLNSEEQRRKARRIDFAKLYRRDEAFCVPLPGTTDELIFDMGTRSVRLGGTTLYWSNIKEITAEESWNGQNLYLVIDPALRPKLSFRQDLRDGEVRKKALYRLIQLLPRLPIPHRRSWWE